MTNSLLEASQATEAPQNSAQESSVPQAARPGDPGFVDRRKAYDENSPARERRQFTNSHKELSPEAAELATAIDSYKATHRRRFLNYEEMLEVIQWLGYKKG